jgi:hypothetical protein
MTALLTAFRLKLIGYRRVESDTEVPPNYSEFKADDPYPVIVFGLSKPISSHRIHEYLTPGFYHYLGIYRNVKNYGLPFTNWLDAPRWVLTLIDRFDDVSEEYERHKKSKGLI